MQNYYQIASDAVIWEKIGNQIVIADLATGVYGCIEIEVGVLIWELLMQGESDNEINRILENHYQTSCEPSTTKFLEKLQELKIVKKSTAPSKNEAISIEYDKLSKQFEEPRVLVYDDLDTLLMIDPIDEDLELSMRQEVV